MYLNLFVQISPDKYMYKRSIYTFFDWLGDVGGLLDALRLIGVVLMAFYTLIMGNPLSGYLVNSLFKRGKEVVTHKDNPSEFDRIKSRNRFSMLPCTFCRSKKEKRVLAKGIERTN